MARYRYMDLLENDNPVDVRIYDPMSFDLSTFEWKGGFTRHTLVEGEIRKFYRVAEKYYGTIEYEDILLLINNIAEPFEMVPGTEIFIPDIQDLRRFLKKRLK